LGTRSLNTKRRTNRERKEESGGQSGIYAGDGGGRGRKELKIGVGPQRKEFEKAGEPLDTNIEKRSARSKQAELTG